MGIRPMREEDREQVQRVRTQAFNQSPEWQQRSMLTPVESQRVWEIDGRIVAALNIRNFGHFFEGASVPCGGVSGVVVLPEVRGMRVAEQMVGAALKEWASITPFSSLFPATVPLYRRLGYEYGLVFTEHTAPISSFPRFKDAIPLSVFTPGDLDEVKTAYRSFAALHNGTMDRSESHWHDRFLKAFDAPVYAYVVREPHGVTGWIVYTQEDGFDIRIQIKDLFYTTEAAAHSILTFLARYDSLGKEARWHGPPAEPLQILFREQSIEVKWQMKAMVRLLNVPAALEARGYKNGTHSVVVDVVDELLPQNTGTWRLTVESGKAHVEPARESGAAMSINTFSGMFSGLLAPPAARSLGLLRASDAEINALEGIFGGRVPWLSDFF